MNIFRYQTVQERHNVIRIFAAIGWFLVLSSALISILPVTETQSVVGPAWSIGVFLQLAAGIFWLKLKFG